jgi:Leucine-rich repeat (LRR) protein
MGAGFSAAYAEGKLMKAAFLLAAALAAAAEIGDLNWIEKRGGAVTRDSRSRVTGVRMDLSWVTDGDVAALASLPNLESLDLAFTLITDAGVEQLRGLKGVKRLNLQSAELLTDTAISHIRGWSGLRSLNLRGTDITDTSMEHIGSLAALTSLDVSYTQITNNGMEFLATLNQLEELSVGGNKVSGPGLHILKSLPRLSRLNLSGAQKRNSGTWATALAEGDMDIIGTLTSSGTQVTSEGLAALKPLRELKRLKLWKARRINDAAVPHLIAHSRLELLDLAESGITEAGVAEVRKALPACQVLWK